MKVYRRLFWVGVGISGLSLILIVILYWIAIQVRRRIARNKREHLSLLKQNDTDDYYLFIEESKLLGQGGGGKVYEGRYDGIDVAIKKIVKWDRNRDFLKLRVMSQIPLYRDLIGLERHQSSMNLKTNGQRKSRTVKLNSKTYDTNALFNMLSSIIIFWIYYILQSVLLWQKMHEFKLSLSENTDGIKIMQIALRNEIYLTCFLKCDTKGFQIDYLKRVTL